MSSPRQIASLKFLGRSLIASLLVFVGGAAVWVPALGVAQEAPEVVLKETQDGVKVSVDGQPFTQLVIKGHDKPILFPVFGPGQVSMTRRWPMEEGVAGEAHDHPHHRSIWVGHEINGLDFWANRTGKIQNESVRIIEGGKAIEARSQWMDKAEDKAVLEDVSVYRFGADQTSRWIDCQITFVASQGPVTFDDTKEGLFAIRTHPDLRLSADPKRGVESVFGKARNSEGLEGEGIWGKPAKWLLYWGPVDDKPVAIGIFDHPQNLRHPTTWHARAYGLVAANPFGLHHFQGLEKGAGEFRLEPGEKLTLRYRMVFWAGTPTVDQVEATYQAFAKH